MNVLSLFDGISGGRLALDRAGIPVTNYYASEVDKWAIKVSKSQYPDIHHLGDVTQWRTWDLPHIDLLIGGSPCQGFSFAGRQLNFEDPRSKLFFEFVDILNHFKPNHFLLENVKMKKEYQDVITEILGVSPILINSALVSAQNRNRLYWCDWEVPQPEDRGILLKDVVEPYYIGKPLSEKEKAYMDREVKGGRTHWDFSHHSDTRDPKSKALVANLHKGVPYNVLILQKGRGKNNGGLKAQDGKTPTMSASKWQDNNHLVIQCNPSNESQGRQPYMQNRVYDPEGKSPALTSFCNRLKIMDKSKTVRSGGRGSQDRHEWDSVYEESHCRKLTPVECERLQTYPDEYTAAVSNTQRYKALGNSFTVEVIAHILRHMEPTGDLRALGPLFQQ